jgi:excisionase family DNA binding protein
MGFENEGQILTTSDSVALTPSFAPKPAHLMHVLITKMMPREGDPHPCGNSNGMKRTLLTFTPIGDRLLTLQEATEGLRLHPRAAREYVSRGEVQGRIIGGQWRFRRADLDAFYENAPASWDFAEKKQSRGLDGEPRPQRTFS